MTTGNEKSLSDCTLRQARTLHHGGKAAHMKGQAAAKDCTGTLPLVLSTTEITAAYGNNLSRSSYDNEL